MKPSLLTMVLALLIAMTTQLFAYEDPSTVSPQRPSERAASLRAESAAHGRMARTLARETGGSRRDRKWRKRMVALCHAYMESAEQAAVAYERASAHVEEIQPSDVRLYGSVPVTAAEYEAAAEDYEKQARSLREDGERHLEMARSSINVDLQPRPGQLGRPYSGGWITSPMDRVARDHCREIAQQSFELARGAEDIAAHYRLRARQLETP